MKDSEFKREVEKMGCEVDDRGCDLFVKRNTHTILTVNKNKEFEFDNEWNKWAVIGEIKSPLFDIAYQLAKTPLVEREEEKRYYLRLATKIDVYEDRRYLNMDIPNEKYTLSENKDDAYYKAIFTESEIAEMDIAGFEKVEVEE